MKTSCWHPFMVLDIETILINQGVFCQTNQQEQTKEGHLGVGSFLYQTEIRNLGYFLCGRLHKYLVSF